MISVDIFVEKRWISRWISCERKVNSFFFSFSFSYYWWITPVFHNVFNLFPHNNPHQKFSVFKDKEIRFFTVST